MKFCPKCGTLMRIDRQTKEWYCPSCGYREPITEEEKKKLRVTTKVNKPLDDDIIVIDDEIGNGNITRAHCPRCNREVEAFFWVMHVPVSDGEDEEVIMYKCKKCGYVWREGDG